MGVESARVIYDALMSIESIIREEPEWASLVVELITMSKDSRMRKLVEWTAAEAGMGYLVFGDGKSVLTEKWVMKLRSAGLVSAAPALFDSTSLACEVTRKGHGILASLFAVHGHRVERVRAKAMHPNMAYKREYLEIIERTCGDSKRSAEGNVSITRDASAAVDAGWERAYAQGLVTIYRRGIYSEIEVAHARAWKTDPLLRGMDAFFREMSQRIIPEPSLKTTGHRTSISWQALAFAKMNWTLEEV